MRIRHLIILIALLSLMPGCYFGITGRVIDVETNQPIEGAVVLVEWTKTHGFGEYWTESYKVVETVSDKDGNVTLPGCYSPFVNPPDVTVYKKGYVAWNNKLIFPKYKKRIDFKWSQGFIAEMMHFEEKKFSHNDHIQFIHGSIHYGLPGSNKGLMEKTVRWEQLKAMDERLKVK